MLLAVNTILMAYIMIATRQLFIVDHAEIVWYRVLHLGQIHYDRFTYAPLFTGLLTGCIQYLPEMWGERLRLSLHLPVLPHRLILTHAAIGLCAFGVIMLLDLGLLTLITIMYFPAEAIYGMMLTTLPWCIAGVVAYFGVTMGLLEPNYRLKVFNLVISAGMISIYLLPAVPGGYEKIFAWLILPVLVMVPAVLLPAYRFRYRRAG